MKKLKSLIFAVFTCIVLFSQSPPSINYQAIAWNLDGTPKALKTINVEFKIHTLKSDGAVEFSEKFLTSTNDQGLFTLAIGSTKLSEFQNVDWAKGPKYLEVIVDNLSVGTTQILSVPYALYAEKTNLKAGPGISVSGNTITNTGDRDTTNEIQQLSLNGTQLTLSKNGGTVALPASGGSGTTYSAGTGISISPTNAISADLKAGEGISIVGNTISNTSTGGGGTGTTYTAGTGIGISGNTITNTGDRDTTNEIQTLSYSNGMLSISKKNTIPFPTVDYLAESNTGDFMIKTRNPDVSNLVGNLKSITVPTTGLYLVYFNAYVRGLLQDDICKIALSLTTTDGATRNCSNNVYFSPRANSSLPSGGSTNWVVPLTINDKVYMQIVLYNLVDRTSLAEVIVADHGFGIVRIR